MLRANFAEKGTGVQFTDAVEAHLAAVTGRDLEAYEASLHDDVSLILPDGTLTEGRQAVTAFGRDWFADPDWSWRPTVVRVTETGDTGVAVYSVGYDDVDREGRPYSLSYLLTLVFARTGTGWLLLHDQNTTTS